MSAKILPDVPAAGRGPSARRSPAWFLLAFWPTLAHPCAPGNVCPLREGEPAPVAGVLYTPEAHESVVRRFAVARVLLDGAREDAARCKASRAVADAACAAALEDAAAVVREPPEAPSRAMWAGLGAVGATVVIIGAVVAGGGL